MKNILLVCFASVFIFTGCADDGIAVNTPDNNKIARYFQQGEVLSQKKVVIDDSMTSTLQGAGVGALGGVAVGRDAKGAAIGAAIGGVVGALIGNEVVAYETLIFSEDKEYKAYLKHYVPKGSLVEFTIKDDQLKNVEVLRLAPID